MPFFRHARSAVVAVLLALSLAPYPAVAAPDPVLAAGTVSGTVVDGAGHPVAGARVAVGTSEALVARTGADGRFALTQVPLGTYAVVVTAPKLGMLRRAAVTVEGDTTLTVRFETDASGLAVIGTASTGVRGTIQAAASEKTRVPLRDTPQSIAVITRDDLQTRAVTSLQQAVQYAPGVVGGSYGADDRNDWITLRGFTPTQFLDGLALPLGTYAQPKIEPYGLQQIDILEGPSAGLYGQSPPGGLIDMVSLRPTAASIGNVTLQTGSYNRAEAAFDFGGAIGGDAHLLYRFVALGRTANAQTQFVSDRRAYVAPSLTWTPTADTAFTLLTHYQHDTTGTVTQFLPEQGTLTANPFGTIPTNTDVAGPGNDRYDKTDDAIGYSFTHRFNDAITVTQNFRYDHIGLFYDTVIGGGLGTDLRTLNRYSYLVNDTDDVLALDNHAEFAFATGAVRHDALAGIDYQRTSEDFGSGLGFPAAIDVYAPNYTPVAAPPISAHTYERQSQLGFYAQDVVRADGFVLTLGGRRDSVGTQVENLITNTATNQTPGAFSGRAGLGYDFSFGLSPYVSYASSFQPTVGSTFAGTPFVPTSGTQLEGGLKYQPTGSRTLVTAAIYGLQQKNALTTDPEHMGFSMQTGLVGVHGFELQAKTALTTTLDLTAAHTYTDARVLAGDNTGERVPLVPQHQDALFLHNSSPTARDARFGYGAGIRYVGATFGDAANAFATPSYTLYDAVADYSWSTWRVQVNATNLFDKVYVPTCNGTADCYYGERRTVFLTLSHR